jgi:hypothetical protein
VPLTVADGEKLERIAEMRDLQPATLCRLALLEFIEKGAYGPSGLSRGWVSRFPGQRRHTFNRRNSSVATSSK